MNSNSIDLSRIYYYWKCSDSATHQKSSEKYGTEKRDEKSKTKYKNAFSCGWSFFSRSLTAAVMYFLCSHPYSFCLYLAISEFQQIYIYSAVDVLYFSFFGIRTCRFSSWLFYLWLIRSVFISYCPNSLTLCTILFGFFSCSFFSFLCFVLVGHDFAFSNFSTSVHGHEANLIAIFLFLFQPHFLSRALSLSLFCFVRFFIYRLVLDWCQLNVDGFHLFVVF